MLTILWVMSALYNFNFYVFENFYNKLLGKKSRVQHLPKNAAENFTIDYMAL